MRSDNEDVHRGSERPTLRDADRIRRAGIHRQPQSWLTIANGQINRLLEDGLIVQHAGLSQRILNERLSNRSGIDLAVRTQDSNRRLEKHVKPLQIAEDRVLPIDGIECLAE